MFRTKKHFLLIILSFLLLISCETVTEGSEKSIIEDNISDDNSAEGRGEPDRTNGSDPLISDNEGIYEFKSDYILGEHGTTSFNQRVLKGHDDIDEKTKSGFFIYTSQHYDHDDDGYGKLELTFGKGYPIDQFHHLFGNMQVNGLYLNYFTNNDIRYRVNKNTTISNHGLNDDVLNFSMHDSPHYSKVQIEKTMNLNEVINSSLYYDEAPSQSDFNINSDIKLKFSKKLQKNLSYIQIGYSYEAQINGSLQRINYSLYHFPKKEDIELISISEKEHEYIKRSMNNMINRKYVPKGMIKDDYSLVQVRINVGSFNKLDNHINFTSNNSDNPNTSYDVYHQQKLSHFISF